MTPYQTRVEEMARAIEEHTGSGGGVTDDDLALAGFTMAEIIEMGDAARRVVQKRVTKKIGKAA